MTDERRSDEQLSAELEAQAVVFVRGFLAAAAAGQLAAYAGQLDGVDVIILGAYQPAASGKDALDVTPIALAFTREIAERVTLKDRDASVDLGGEQ
jgi:hypothetical protein